MSGAHFQSWHQSSEIETLPRSGDLVPVVPVAYCSSSACVC